MITDMTPEASGSEEPEPSLDELVDAFEQGEPAAFERPPGRKLSVQYRFDGGIWHASSPDIATFRLQAKTLEAARAQAKDLLSSYVGPEVSIRERMLGTGGTAAAGRARVIRGPALKTVSTGAAGIAVSSASPLVKTS